MANQLRFTLTYLPTPYQEEIGIRTEGWGRLACALIQNGAAETLFQTEWNLDELAEWYIEFGGQLCRVPLPETPQPGESLAQAFDRMMSREFTDEAEANVWYDQLYQFREIHYLPLWLRGANLAPIIIGCNGDEGEISFYLDDEIPQADYERLIAPSGLTKRGNWSYTFDMPAFKQQLHAELAQFLSTWRDSTPYDEGMVRAASLLEQVRQIN